MNRLQWPSLSNLPYWVTGLWVSPKRKWPWVRNDARSDLGDHWGWPWRSWQLEAACTLHSTQQGRWWRRRRGGRRGGETHLYVYHMVAVEEEELGWNCKKKTSAKIIVGYFFLKLAKYGNHVWNWIGKCETARLKQVITNFYLRFYLVIWVWLSDYVFNYHSWNN